MIVVCGQLDPDARANSLAVTVADRAVRAGAGVEIVGLIPGDSAGDRLVLRLAAAGIGHAAVLRAPARSLEAADIDLALRYLPDIRVVVAAGLPADLAAAVAAAAAFADATLVVLAYGPDDSVGAPEMGPDETTIVIAAPARDPDGTFAGFVAGFAVRLDAGEVPADAWSGTVRAMAVDAVS